MSSILKIVIFYSLFLVSILSFGQGSNQFQFYNDGGNLMADPRFNINEGDLKKWNTIDYYFLNTLIDNIKYPQVYLENNVSDTLIVSFVIDTSGSISNFKIEASRLDTSLHKNVFALMLKSSIEKSNRSLQMIWSDKNLNKRASKFFIPVTFNINMKKSKTEIRNGWINCTHQDLIIYIQH